MYCYFEQASKVFSRTFIETNEIIQIIHNLAVCTCDMTENACDVNCCCDPDCTASDRLAFSKCSDEYTPADNRACVRSDIIFTDNSPFEVDTTQPGLFCVEYDNYEERNYYNIPDPVNDTETFQEIEAEFSTFSFKKSSSSLSVPQEFYKSGDVILTVYENLALGSLSLPSPSINSQCQDLNPASFLIPESTQCLRSIQTLASDCMTNPALDAQTYFNGFKVVANPVLFKALFPNETENATEYTTLAPMTPQTDIPLYNNSLLLSISPDGPHTCIDSYGLSYSCNFTDEIPSPSYEEDPSQPGSYFCYNSVVKATYKVIYNGTDGIISVHLAFTLRDLSDSNLPLSQSFVTEFAQEFQTEDPFKRSGNPGYVQSKPVMAGTLVSDTDNLGNPIYSIQLNSDPNQWMTMAKSALTAGRLPSCVEGVETREPVLFGVGMRSGCFVSFSFNNMTELCNLTQWAAWEALRGPNPSTYIASFGNSDVEKVGDWVPILGASDQPQRVIPGSDPGTCLNVLTGLNIQIVYANVGAIDNPQPKILGARYQYQYVEQLKYQCIGPFCQPGLEGLPQNFEISSSVQFIDASESVRGVSARIPKVTARLPDDFFYPFA
ncbi:hypothetical protein CAPTEDRAFT_228697 [Capitella teleta]|uniref:Uncharacterized protein n=1 Tax=Capitella teleta TaxID=283909 RepID=R7TDW2_CAPTE|nr:hypothetical protein CAPTEDRAFT_228697 [Capitella teleta]|eukprot:ELT91904.1 hypothetical protein CAPTEDRAFT_228697 [Capitella teleta]